MNNTLLNKIKFFIGTSGWSYQHWKERFYPQGLPSNKWLSYYADYFNSVELNMSFYRTPFPNMINSWINKTHANFIFSVKASRYITHIKKLTNIDDSIKKLYDLVYKFRQKCKCILFQFPPSFQMNENTLLKVNNLLELLDYNYDHSFEFRHKSWWNDKCYKILKNKVAFCIVNGLNMPKDFIATHNFLYFRFHGNKYDSCYSENEIIDSLKNILDFIIKNKIYRVYIYFNNDNNCYAIKNAIFLKENLNALYK